MPSKRSKARRCKSLPAPAPGIISSALPDTTPTPANTTSSLETSPGDFLNTRNDDTLPVFQSSGDPKPPKAALEKKNMEALPTKIITFSRYSGIRVMSSDCATPSPVEIPKIEVSASDINDYSSYVSVITSLSEYIERVLDSEKTLSGKGKTAIKDSLKEINESTIKLGTVLSVPSHSLSNSLSHNDLKNMITSTVREELKYKLSEDQTLKDSTTNSGAPTFAAIAAKPPPTKVVTVTQPKSALKVVKATDASKKPNEVLGQVKKNVTFNIPEYVPNKIPNRSVDAEQDKYRPPLLLIKGIRNEIKRDDLIKIIEQQNFVSDLRLCFLLSTSNKDLYNAVIEVNPETRATIMRQGKIYIDYETMHVEDYSRFLQCFKCLRFGHTSTVCISESSHCAHCAQTGHSTAQCPYLEQNDFMKCFNCMRYNEKTGSNMDINHNATDIRVCPQIQQTKRLIDSRTNYGC